MVLTTAFAGPRGTAKPAPGGHRNKPLANIAQTSSEGDALARAVRALKPTENHGVAVTLAERQTRHDLNLAEQPELPPDTDDDEN